MICTRRSKNKALDWADERVAFARDETPVSDDNLATCHIEPTGG